ncbi:NAD(P)/FAD-dependent oxidoreductase [Pedobacter sp. SYSU D00535]|uniref:NAD(P)/FAD-dependent oxidoreductase n=1 Tax=Pedobacter sp. SYSU D00535 TaxID=2810308 RepID=UPI001A96BA87|nr:NAD(P)/FAD-dependent oxidoreductase [Pedobacter sp. SYSU D00535]
MEINTEFEVIIIGGSYSGLSAAMALGRSIRKVLVIDSGKPCNIQTPDSHNFLTQDGKRPVEISEIARQQVLAYETVTLRKGRVTNGTKTKQGFEVGTDVGESFKAKKLLFATGVKDVMPKIEGFAECWGISVIHCPYCHGYEVKNEKTGMLANGDLAYDLAKLLTNWTGDLTLFTNGVSSLKPEQKNQLQERSIAIVEKEIKEIAHTDGQLRHVACNDGSIFPLTALYARIPFEQHSNVPQALGVELTELGHLKVDPFQKTNIPGIYACGDSASMMRSVANAVASGNLAGAMVNKELIDEAF